MATGDHKAVVTPEMVRAGVESIEALDLRFAVREEIVAAIYHAMRAKAQSCDCQDGE